MEVRVNISQSSNRRRVCAGVSLLGLSITFLSNTAMGLMIDPASPSPKMIAVVGFVAVLSMVLMTGAILGLSQLLRARADWAGLVGAAATLAGWAVSTRISTLIQLDALLRAGVEGVPASALESTFKSAPLVWVSMFPIGLSFPLGLITLGVALFWWRPLNRWSGLLLALGGVLFPIGRAMGNEFAYIACDITLAAAFVSLGWQVLSRPEAWETTSDESEFVAEMMPGELRARA